MTGAQPAIEPAGRDHTAAAVTYCEDVIAGRVLTGVYVQLAAQRFLDQISRDGRYRYQTGPVTRVCSFLECLPHVKGKWRKSNELLVLPPWVCFALAGTYGFVDDDGLRLIRELYLEVARKNAKTTVAAGLGLYHITLDDEFGAEIYCGATSEKQAHEVFGTAKEMCKLDEDIVDEFGLDLRAKRILVEDTFSKFEPLIRNPGDGANPSCYVADEFHEHVTSTQYDAMVDGMMSREQPLTLIITTAGFNSAGPCYARRRFHLQSLQGVVHAPRLFSLIYTLDEGDDWTDFETNLKANPNYGISVNSETLRALHGEAIQDETRQASYQRKHCNLWIGATATFLNLAKWMQAPARPEFDAQAGRQCYLGVDLATKVDLAALCALFPPDDEISVWCAYWWYWTTEERLSLSENAHLAAWHKAGLIYASAGSRIDTEDITAKVGEIATECEVIELGYDPYHATSLAADCSSLGLATTDVPQHVKYLSPAMRELEALCDELALAHGADECTSWQCSNLEAFEDRKSNVFPRKAVKANKIDGMIALLLALARATAPGEVVEESIYNTRGLRTV